MYRHINNYSQCSNGCLVIIAILVLGGCHQKESSTAREAPAAVRVSVQPVQASNREGGIAYSGTITEQTAIPLSFPVNGLTEKVLVNAGQSVRKGQLLATLQQGSFQNTYDIALIQEKRAQDAYTRMKPMYENGNLPPIKWVEVESGLQQAQQSVQIARKNLQDCNLYAPDSGVIGERLIEPGQNVIPGNPALRLVKLNKVYVKIPIPENEIAGIQKGQKAHVLVQALSNKAYGGHIEEIGVLASQFAHTYDVKIGLSNLQGNLRPGMVCSVFLSNPAGTGGLAVPNQAVQVDENGEHFVYIVDASGKKALRKTIQTGSMLREGIAVTAGLTPQDRIITSGFQKIASGTPIAIVQ